MPDFMTVPASRVPLCRFLDTLAQALEESGRPALWIPRQYAVLFREGETLNSVRPIPWGSDSREAPRLTRVGVNQYDTEVSRRTRILLGFLPEARPGQDERLELEFTVLTGELEAIAPWLPIWIAGRVEPEVPIPAPPVLCDPWKFDWGATNYVWTTAAWNAQTDWEEREKAARAERAERRQAAIQECGRRAGEARPRNASGGQAQVGKEDRHV